MHTADHLCPLLLALTASASCVSAELLPEYYKARDYERAEKALDRAERRARRDGDLEGVVYAQRDAIDLVVQKGAFPSTDRLKEFHKQWGYLERVDLRRIGETEYTSWSRIGASGARYDAYERMPEGLARTLIDATNDVCDRCAEQIAQCLGTTYDRGTEAFSYSDVISAFRLAQLAQSRDAAAIREAAPGIHPDIAEATGFITWLRERSGFDEQTVNAIVASFGAPLPEAAFQAAADLFVKNDYSVDTIGLWDGHAMGPVHGQPARVQSTSSGFGTADGYFYLDAASKFPLRVPRGVFFLMQRGNAPIVLVETKFMLETTVHRTGGILINTATTVDCRLNDETGEPIDESTSKCPRYAVGTFSLDLSDIDFHTNRAYVPDAASVTTMEDGVERTVTFYLFSVPAGDYAAVVLDEPDMTKNESLMLRVVRGGGAPSDSLASVDTSMDNVIGQRFVGATTRALADLLRK
ncbi:MAG: hypothetical protein JNL82_41165 [Myxococcales bacterium]|nr:hypothetical protein [Myxococcales bacterium]